MVVADAESADVRRAVCVGASSAERTAEVSSRANPSDSPTPIPLARSMLLPTGPESSITNAPSSAE
jgi:hypothetical protein